MAVQEKLPQRTLGRGTAALKSSIQGFGCMGLSAFYSTHNDASEEDKIAFLHHIIDSGVTHLDTSDVYGPFTNEVLVGKAIKAYPREKILLATKFGNRIIDGVFSVRGDREYVRSACEASLQRLGLDYIDLYYVHRIDQTVPIEETMQELSLLVKEGKIKHIGLSEASAETIRRAHAVHPITAVQLEWSLWSRDVEEDIIPVLRELGIGIVAYSPLGRGFLTGTIQKNEDIKEGDFRKGHPRFQEDAIKQNVTLLDALTKISKEKNCTLGQLSLAWVQHQGEDVVPIPGTTKLKHFQENLEALKVQLSNQDLKAIADALPHHGVVGTRYKTGSPYKNDKNPTKKKENQ